MASARVLFVSHDHALARVLAITLPHHRYVVESATDVTAAIGAIELHRFDAIIVDLNGVDDRADGVGRIRRTTDTPVLALVDATVDGDSSSAVEAGAADILRTPFHGPALVDRLDALVGRFDPAPMTAGDGMTRRDRRAWLRDPRVDEREVAHLGVAAAGALARRDPLWPGQLATLVALALFLALPPKLTVGPNWPLPVAEAAVVAALIIAGLRGRDAKRRREVAIGLVLVATLANLTALGLLTHYLIAGGRAQGTDLIGGGVLIWSTNLLLFAVLSWELDRGGPRSAVEDSTHVAPDFLFTEQPTAPRWRPGFIDYLYVSLTNQSAFSPTDTMPLTPRMKVLMGIQGTAALVTVGVIVARAVNILS